MATHFLDTHMNFRMSSEDKNLIASAARLRGLKLNTYVRQKLLEVAERDIAELNQNQTLLLSNEDWERFVEIMEAPIKINQNLKRAFQEFDAND